MIEKHTTHVTTITNAAGEALLTIQVINTTSESGAESSVEVRAKDYAAAVSTDQLRTFGQEVIEAADQLDI